MMADGLGVVVWSYWLGRHDWVIVSCGRVLHWVVPPPRVGFVGSGGRRHPELTNVHLVRVIVLAVRSRNVDLKRKIRVSNS